MPTHEHALALLEIANTGVPIYVQLRDQLLRIIAIGLLRPGDQMPTMRQVAIALRVDLNTVRHAYDELERAGVVILVRGRGSFVADTGVSPGLVQEEQTDALARQTLATAEAMGIPPARLADRIAALAANLEKSE